jgi:hypothetical protein
MRLAGRPQHPALSPARDGVAGCRSVRRRSAHNLTGPPRDAQVAPCSLSAGAEPGPWVTTGTAACLGHRGTAVAGDGFVGMVHLVAVIGWWVAGGPPRAGVGGPPRSIGGRPGIVRSGQAGLCSSCPYRCCDRGGEPLRPYPGAVGQRELNRHRALLSPGHPQAGRRRKARGGGIAVVGVYQSQ